MTYYRGTRKENEFVSKSHQRDKVKNLFDVDPACLVSPTEDLLYASP